MSELRKCVAATAGMGDFSRSRFRLDYTHLHGAFLCGGM